jgi:hypothetical protein
MTAHELLSQLRARGVEVKTSGDDRLVIDAPRGTVNEELRAALSANKAGLLQILKDENIEAEAPASVEATAPEPAPLPVREAIAPPPHIDDQIAASTAEEIGQLQAELMRLRIEEEARRAEVESARLAAENALRVEQERWRQQEEEIARQRAEHERRRIDAEARERAEEEQRRQIAAEEIARAEEVLVALRAGEEKRRHEAEAHFQVGKQAHEAQLASLRQAEEKQASQRAEEERRYLELEARKRAQEDELRRRAETRFRAVEDEVERVRAREQARLKAEQEAQFLAEEAERRRAEEAARRQAEEQARRRAEEETRLRAEIEAQLRAEAAERRRVEEEARLQAEEEARRRAEEEAQRIAAEAARRLAEEEALSHAAEEARRQAEAAAMLKAKEDAQRHAAEQARFQAEQDERDRIEAVARERAELEARIRAEIEAKIRGEEADKRREEEAERRRAEHERIVAEEAARAAAKPEFPFEIERAEVEEPAPHVTHASDNKVTEIAEWFEVGLEKQIEAVPVEDHSQDHFLLPADEDDSEFRAVSVPEEVIHHRPEVSQDIENDLRSSNSSARAAAVAELPQVGGEQAYHHITAAFDDQSAEVRSAAARALFDLQDDRAAAFTRALREASPDRRRSIGAAIASSGLANEAIRNLTGESRDKTYDAFSLLFLMSKAGEVKPLMRAIEEHPNTEVRLAVVKLLALSGQPDVLAAFRRMAVRGSLPSEVRSAVMEAIYQITSQTPVEAGSM